MFTWFYFFHAYGHFIIDLVIVCVSYKLQQLLLASLVIDADFEANPKSYLDNTIDLLRSDQSCIWKHLLSIWMGWMDLCHKLARSRCCNICQWDWSNLECANIYITPSHWFCAAPQGSQWRTSLRKSCTMAYRFRRQIGKLTSRMATVLNPTGINVVLPYCLANFEVTCYWLRELPSDATQNSSKKCRECHWSFTQRNWEILVVKKQFFWDGCLGLRENNIWPKSLMRNSQPFQH